MKNKGLEIADLRSAMLVTTFFSLWLAIFFSRPVEHVFAFLLIFSFGILHGANDLEILRRKQVKANNKVSKRRMLITYIASVLAGAAIFYVFPIFSLAFFILFSAFHFGEQHWVSRKGGTSILRNMLYIAYGLAILLMLFHAHGPEVAGIMWEITGYRIDDSWFGTGSLIAIGSFSLAALCIFPWGQALRYLGRELLLLALFFVVFTTASLIWAFAIYFVLWHAIPSLADQIQLMYGPVNMKNGYDYIKSSAVYWIGALASLAIVFLYFRENDFGFLPLFFSFLAAITFPHVLVIAKLYQNKKGH